MMANITKSNLGAATVQHIKHRQHRSTGQQGRQSEAVLLWGDYGPLVVFSQVTGNETSPEPIAVIQWQGTK